MEPRLQGLRPWQPLPHRTHAHHPFSVASISGEKRILHAKTSAPPQRSERAGTVGGIRPWQVPWIIAARSCSRRLIGLAGPGLTPPCPCHEPSLEGELHPSQPCMHMSQTCDYQMQAKPWHHRDTLLLQPRTHLFLLLFSSSARQPCFPKRGLHYRNGLHFPPELARVLQISPTPCIQYCNSVP